MKTSARPGVLAALVLLAAFGLCGTAGPAQAGVQSIHWVPASSTYTTGGSGTAVDFNQLQPPESWVGYGTTNKPGGISLWAVGASDWNTLAGTYSLGFFHFNLGSGDPFPEPLTFADTELSATPLTPGTTLHLVFAKDAGTQVNSISFIGDAGKLVLVGFSGGADLTAATSFTVDATIVDPVQSASGDASSVFGLQVNASSAPTDAYDGAVFLANVHWFDVTPPVATVAGVIGTRVDLVGGVTATLTGICPPALLTKLGVTGVNLPSGYVDSSEILPGNPDVAFTDLGWGDGTQWNTGYRKLQITSKLGGAHDYFYGKLKPPPGKPRCRAPKGLITSARPRFRWSEVAGAWRYELKVWTGRRVIVNKRGLAGTAWRCSKRLPKGVFLKWRVRAVAAIYVPGSWSTAARFKVK